jgi:hypothetical protein
MDLIPDQIRAAFFGRQEAQDHEGLLRQIFEIPCKCIHGPSGMENLLYCP